MALFDDANICRICVKKQDSLYPLFNKRNGITAYEKLNKIGVKIIVDDGRPCCICSECLTELDITLSFLEKCEKSNEILTGELTQKLQYSTHDCNTHESNSENNHLVILQEENIDNTFDEEVKNIDVVSLEKLKCSKCGSKRRCKHWTPPTTHTCPHCQKIFTRKFNFKLHLKRHNGDWEWSCCVCGARTVSRWLAERHCTPRTRRQCPVPGCNKTYTTNTNLNTHLRMHSGERPFACSACDKKFSSKKTLNDHIRIHTGALPYICPVCGKRFRTNKLSAHMSTHSARLPRTRHPAPLASRTEPAHVCSHCPARYQHKQSLNKHIKKQHSQKQMATQVELNQDSKQIHCEQQTNVWK